MTLRQEVAQLVIAPFYGEVLSARSKASREYQRLVQSGLGGLIILNRVRGGLVQNAEPHAMAAFLNRMQRAARIPLLVGGDFERGASMRVSSTVKFPHAMAFGAAGDLAATTAFGRYSAREARALGVHWVFAPVADVNNNPANPVIGLRSFGEAADTVSRHVAAYIEGARSEAGSPVLLCVKHFPGHGDTAVDTHFGLATVTADRERLQSLEWKPFRTAIAAGIDGVMTGHLFVPALESDPIPATVSSKVLTGVLRRELGFQGLLSTDAMDMAGLTQQFPAGEAAVRSLEAGVDVLLVPSNADAVINGVVKAVESGRLSRQRIRQSVEKLLAAKLKLGLASKRLVDTEELADVLDDPDAQQLAQSVAERALTLVRNEGEILPLRERDRSCLFVLNESRYSPQGRQLLDTLKEKAPRMLARPIDATMDAEALDAVIAKARDCAAVVIATTTTATAWQGNPDAAMSPALTGFVERLLAGPAPVALASFGNPYLIRYFPKVAAYVAAFSTAPTSEAALARALIGEIGFAGKLPVTIPGIAERVR